MAAADPVAVAQAVGFKMLGKLKKVFGKTCHYCGELAEEPVKAEVKIPGYTGRHEKNFCSKEHLEKWQEYIKEWEEENYEIPDKNKGPTCVNCMR